MEHENWAQTILEQNHKEITVGGDLEPCPFCSLPRCSRSDYIRCSKCGINWLAGEDLDVNPKIARFRKVVEDAKAEAARNTARNKGK